MYQTTLSIPASASGQVMCDSLTSEVGFMFQVESKTNPQSDNFLFKGGSATGPVSYNNLGETVAHLTKNGNAYDLSLTVTGYDFDENYNIDEPDVTKKDMNEYFSYLLTATGSDFNTEIGRVVVILSPEDQTIAP